LKLNNPGYYRGCGGSREEHPVIEKLDDDEKKVYDFEAEFAFKEKKF
jgi:hypothetical protein